MISCSNQPENQSATKPIENETEASNITDIPPEPEVAPGTQVLEPTVTELQLGETEGGGYTNQAIAQLFRDGTTAYDNKDFTSGIKFFQEIIEKQPKDTRAYYNLGIGYFNLDMFPQAIKAFSDGININPRDSLSIQFRGRVYYMMGDYKNCLTDYSRVVELMPKDPVSYYNRGTAKGRTNDFLGAIKDFDKAIELNPDYAEAFYNRGLANFYQGRLHDACFDWRKAHGLGHYEAEKAIRTYCESKEEE